MEISAEGKKLTFGMVTRALKLSKLQIRALFLTVLREPMPAEDESLNDKFLVTLVFAELLEKIAFLLPEQRTAIMTEIWIALFNTPAFETQFNQIVFIDSQVTTWTGATGFLDLQTGEWISELPHPAMETIGYNLNELYRREKLRIEKRSGFHVKKHNAGGVDEPGDIRLSLADDVHRPLRLGGPDVGPDDDLDGSRGGI
jgi:hypothetical protein